MPIQDMQETRVQSLDQECLLEEDGYPFQCFCLENPMDRGAWWATVQGVAKSWTQLKQLSMHTRLVATMFDSEDQDIPSSHKVLLALTIGSLIS